MMNKPRVIELYMTTLWEDNHFFMASSEAEDQCQNNLKNNVKDENMLASFTQYFPKTFLYLRMTVKALM